MDFFLGDAPRFAVVGIALIEEVGAVILLLKNFLAFHDVYVAFARMLDALAV